MKDIYIGGALRTAVGSFGGGLSGVSAGELGRLVVTGLLERLHLAPTEVDELLLGSVLQAGLGQNVARQILVNSGLPVEKTAMTINMLRHFTVELGKVE